MVARISTGSGVSSSITSSSGSGGSGRGGVGASPSATLRTPLDAFRAATADNTQAAATSSTDLLSPTKSPAAAAVPGMGGGGGGVRGGGRGWAVLRSKVKQQQTAKGSLSGVKLLGSPHHSGGSGSRDLLAVVVFNDFARALLRNRGVLKMDKKGMFVNGAAR